MERGPASLNEPTMEVALRAHQPALLLLAERLCQNRPDAHDLVQDTFERALRAWRRLPPGANIRAWLAAILNNLFIDRRRRALRAPRVHTIGNIEVPAPEARATPVWKEVTAEQVRAAIVELEDPFRCAYELHAFGGRSYREIADVLGIPTSTVGTRLLRARRMLRLLLLRSVRPDAEEGLTARIPRAD